MFLESVQVRGSFQLFCQPIFLLVNWVPELSSVAMPNPSALFCLSNAFRSRTLDMRKPHKSITGTFCTQCIDRLSEVLKRMFLQSLTCMTAWVQPCSERSQRLASLSDNPAFSITQKHQTHAVINEGEYTEYKRDVFWHNGKTPRVMKWFPFLDFPLM